MKKKLIFLLVMAMVLLMAPGCKNIFGPEEPEDPWKYGGRIEILVEDPITSTYDWTKICLGFYNVANSQSLFSTRFTLLETTAETRRWIAYVELNCSPQPYYVNIGNSLPEETGEKFYLRREIDTDWLGLTCIEPFPPRIDLYSYKFMFQTKLWNSC